MSDKYLSAEAEGIGALIEGRRLFRVPDHQRDFAWTRDDVERFLDDVEVAIEENADEYFVGLVVLVKPGADAAWEILDGQQRLATVTMVYAAICDWLHSSDDAKEAHKIQSSFIGFSEIGDKADRARLTMNVNDRGCFADFVVGRASDDALRERLGTAGRFSSERRLLEAGLLCRERVREIAQRDGAPAAEQASRLFRLARYVRDRVTVVCMDVESTANAYTVFESLNDRGLDLSVLDLVKNHMFGRAPPSLADVSRNWTAMATNLGDRPADDFLKAFWTSRFGRIQRGRLFDEWKEKYPAHEAVRKVSKELVEVAEQYAALGVADHDVWADYGKGVQDSIRTLALLGNHQIRAVLLSALARFDVMEMEKLLRLLVSMTVRYQVVGQRRTGALEISCAKIAHQIFTGNLDTATKVWREFAPIVPDDLEFRQDLATHVESKAPRARYLLRELELVARRKSAGREPELAAAEGLTLEHVLPKNAGQEWAKELRADSDLPGCVDRLGNLCLLTEKQNRKIGNRGYREKSKQLYTHSELILTSEIPESAETWSRASIEERQQRLADLAVQAWPIPEQPRSPGRS